MPLHIFFDGRLSILGYWISFLVLGVLFTPFMMPFSDIAQNYMFIRSFIFTILIFILTSIFVRRLHDLGLSGWWVITLTIPILSVIIGVLLGLWPGEKRTNQYGEKNKLLSQVFPFIKNY